MTDDLIERLHSCEYVAYYDGEPGIVADENLLHEAADRIETQANTIEELRSANERWAIAFNQAEERTYELMDIRRDIEAHLSGGSRAANMDEINQIWEMLERMLRLIEKETSDGQ